MLVPLIAQHPLIYDEKRYAVGDPFTALSENDARVLTLLGKARAALPPVVVINQPAGTRLTTTTPLVAPAPPQESVSEQEPVESTPETEAQPRRTRRRTLTAEATEA